MVACEAVSLARPAANSLFFPFSRKWQKMQGILLCFYSLGFRLRVMLSVLERNVNGLIELYELVRP